jgi:hypothetical protein
MLIGQAEIGYGRADLWSDRLDVDFPRLGLLLRSKQAPAQHAERRNQTDADRRRPHMLLIPEAGRFIPGASGINERVVDIIE